jgi:hypothetical protein
MFKRVETRVERALFQRLKLEYDEPLSNFAFNFNVRRYTKVAFPAKYANSEPPKAGWRKLKPVDIRVGSA